MANESKQQGNFSTYQVIGYIRAFVFLALGTFLITRVEIQFKIVGVLFVLYGFWRIYSTYKRSHPKDNEEKAD